MKGWPPPPSHFMTKTSIQVSTCKAAGIPIRICGFIFWFFSQNQLKLFYMFIVLLLFILQYKNKKHNLMLSR